MNEREPIGLALRRLKKQLERLGIAREMRSRSHFVEPALVRRKKKFRKRLKAREDTLRRKQAGEQPVADLADACRTFRKRTGKP